MPADHQPIDNHVLFAAWLENTLTEEQREEFEKRCIDDTEFAARVEAASQTQMMADMFEPERVPDWNRNATFPVAPSYSNFWQRWLPTASMAMSCLTFVLLISNASMKVDDNGFVLSFNRSIDEDKMLATVNQKLDQFANTQRQTLFEYGQTLQQHQLETGRQLTSYLLDTSREERREDFAELVRFINTQREDDQRFYARQFNQLQASVEENVAELPSYQPLIVEP